jgi:hypothetical protein
MEGIDSERDENRRRQESRDVKTRKSAGRRVRNCRKEQIRWKHRDMANLVTHGRT